MRAFEKLIPFLRQRAEQKGAYILLDSSQKIPLTMDAFQSLAPQTSDQKLVFVDGGNGEFVRGASMSVHFARIVAITYKNNKRINRLIKECIIAVTAKELVYEAKVLDREGNELLNLSFDAFDQNLCNNTHRADPSTVANHVRKLLEIISAKDIISTLSCNDILVRDGDFSTSGLEKQFDDLKAVSNQKGVKIVALSKTSRLVTDAGGSATVVLSRMAPSSPWLYNFSPVGFVKLHPRSKYVFRLDSFDQSSLKNISEILAKNSEDPAFLGYPYGLVEADKFARITHKELALLKAHFSVSSRDAFSDVEASVDAHDLLSSL